VLVLADGGFDVLDLRHELPEGVILVTRMARNRCLYYLPKTSPARDALLFMENALPIRQTGCMLVCATGPLSLLKCGAIRSRCVTNSWDLLCAKGCRNDHSS